MSDGDRARVERLLGSGDLAWLLERVRRRLGAGEALVGQVGLQRATPAQREAVGKLLGWPQRPTAGVRVRLEDVDLVLRRSGAWPAGLASAVQELTGPVVVRAEAASAERLAWAAAWATLRAGLAEHPRAHLREPLRAWWDAEVAAGLPRRLARTPQAAEELARDLLAVLVRLPAEGVAIGSLAHAATGSAHALDAGPLAALALRAARVLAAAAGAPGLGATRGAEAERAAWSAVGVVRDELSSTVLTLGLPAGSTGASGRALAAWSAVAQPVLLSLRHLRRDPPAWEPPVGGGRGATVWVCENPVVVAAVADRALGQGAPTPPVVCSGGQPSAAALQVLRGLSAAGWVLRHHGDLDPDGVRITDRLVREVGARPWRMGAVDYVRALAAGHGRRAPVDALTASWDDELGPAMLAAGQVVEEEAVLEELLADVLPGTDDRHERLPPLHPHSRR